MSDLKRELLTAAETGILSDFGKALLDERLPDGCADLVANLILGAAFRSKAEWYARARGIYKDRREAGDTVEDALAVAVRETPALSEQSVRTEVLHPSPSTRAQMQK